MYSEFNASETQDVRNLREIIQKTREYRGEMLESTCIFIVSYIKFV